MSELEKLEAHCEELSVEFNQLINLAVPASAEERTKIELFAIKCMAFSGSVLHEHGHEAVFCFLQQKMVQKSLEQMFDFLSDADLDELDD